MGWEGEGGASLASSHARVDVEECSVALWASRTAALVRPAPPPPTTKPPLGCWKGAASACMRAACCADAPRKEAFQASAGRPGSAVEDGGREGER